MDKIDFRIKDKGNINRIEEATEWIMNNSIIKPSKASALRYIFLTGLERIEEMNR